MDPTTVVACQNCEYTKTKENLVTAYMVGFGHMDSTGHSVVYSSPK